MDPNENYPSLIDCLDTGSHGFFLALFPPAGLRDDGSTTTVVRGPFSKTLAATIKTGGNDPITHVHLVMQRDRYDPPDSLLPLSNPGLEAAWQQAFDFHHSNAQTNGLIVLDHQLNAKGELQGFAPLFRCQQTRQWFHPVCPQCGMALKLCRDDALLGRRGLPTFTGSLARLLYCETCAGLSAEAPFYIRRKSNNLPDVVQDKDALVARWQHLLATLPDDADLPCRGCAEQEACYGPQSLANQRITAFSFYPFYLLMFPAPSCSAAEFIPMISGERGSVAAHETSSGSSNFFFNDLERRFLEILYLKLAFLEQLCDQLLSDSQSVAMLPANLSLDSIGVDLNPGGIGLPAFWNFNTRMLDMIGSVQTSPFAPTMPETPRLHCLGALWFHTLLVNGDQQAERVFGEVGRLVAEMAVEDGPDEIDWDLAGPDSVFAAKQIMSSPVHIDLPEKWQAFWKQTLQLGGQLVHAGLKAGVPWDGDHFRASMASLMDSIKREMFTKTAAGDLAESVPAQTTRLGVVLNTILQKWQSSEAEAIAPIPDQWESEPMAADEAIVKASGRSLPVEPSHIDSSGQDHPDPASPQPYSSGWDSDIQKTVILSSPDSGMDDNAVQTTASEPVTSENNWDDPLEETVILPGAGATAPTAPPSTGDELEKTVVISASSQSSRTEPDADLEATIVQGSSGKAPAGPDDVESDFEATVIINAREAPLAPDKPAGDTDADLEATLVQDGLNAQPDSPGPPGDATRPPAGQWQNGDDLDATVVTKPAARPPSSISSQATNDDDLEATVIETPRDNSTPAVPPPSPVMPDSFHRPDGIKPPDGRDVPSSGTPDSAGEDEDIMEQTIIIRSDVKKE